jgi:hypothetical protein
MLDYNQESFLGGINQQFDPTRIGKNEYMLGINVRNREDVLMPIKEPLDITNKKPKGKLQGIYGAGNLLVLFVDGKAYFKDFISNPESPFYHVPGGMQLDKDVENIFAEFVPASNINFFRAQNAETNTNINATVQYHYKTTFLNGRKWKSAISPTGLLVQDGINQPWIITEGGSRVTQTYEQWKVFGGETGEEDFREYVPIGKQMLYSNGVLKIVSSDGKQVFRSVTGRPLDFVIAIDGIEGNKAADASETSYKPEYNTITSLKDFNATTTKGFFVGTRTTSRLLIPAADALLFGESLGVTYSFLFPTGPANHFSVVDISGDTAFITDSGIRSFNGTQTLLYESNNDPFSAKVYRLFDGVTQVSPCACNFDNYALFAVTTKYGPGILVYDTLSKSFCSLDIYEGVSQIKQFAVVQYNNIKRLFFYTDDNKLYEAYASDKTATAQVYIGEFTSGDPAIEQQATVLNVVLIDAEESGTITATIMVDRKSDEPQIKTVEKRIEAQPVGSPIQIPFGALSKDTVQNFTFGNLQAATGWKIGYLIKWNCMASLSHIKVSSEQREGNVVNFEEASRTYVAASES